MQLYDAAMPFALLGASVLQAASSARRAKKSIPQPSAAKRHRLRKIIMSTVKVSTTFGQITLKLRPDAAPKTVEHFCKLAPLFDGCCFYRSDFVIQGGLQRADGSSVPNPMKPIPVNETHTDVVLSNVRGTAAFGHWDVPDAGNSDWFINLKDNAHLDSAYGGYAVFAAVDPGDAASFATIDSIARNILEGGKPTINFVHIE